MSNVKLADVIAVLRCTIAAKCRFLDDIRFCNDTSLAVQITADFLEVNIAELKKILADLEKVES